MVNPTINGRWGSVALNLENAKTRISCHGLLSISILFIFFCDYFLRGEIENW